MIKRPALNQQKLSSQGAAVSWRFTQTEIDVIDAGLQPFVDSVMKKWTESGQATVVSNEGLMSLLLQRGGEYAEFVNLVRKRPGAAKKLGDHARTMLKTLGYRKKTGD